MVGHLSPSKTIWPSGSRETMVAPYWLVRTTPTVKIWRETQDPVEEEAPRAGEAVKCRRCREPIHVAPRISVSSPFSWYDSSGCRPIE